MLHDTVSVPAKAGHKPKYAELIKAWADGAVIQGRDSANGWEDLDGPGGHCQPAWYDDFEYQLKPAEPQRWSHQFSIAFSVTSPSHDPDSVSSSELRAALTERISDLDNDGSMYEACGYTGDSYYVEPV